MWKKNFYIYNEELRYTSARNRFILRNYAHIITIPQKLKNTCFLLIIFIGKISYKIKFQITETNFKLSNNKSKFSIKYIFLFLNQHII